MIIDMIPKYKYWETNYPHLESGSEGRPIPEFYGEKENITPVCIDTTILKYKIAKRKMLELTAVRADASTLVADVDYIADLNNAEFTVYGMPFLQKETTYYFVLEGDYALSGSNYMHVGGDSSGSYTDGQFYTIDGGDSWTSQSAIDLCFKIYGRTWLDADEELMVEYGFANQNANYPLRNGAANTKIAQSFLTGANDFFMTRIIVWLKEVGSPSGNLRVEIHSDQEGATVGGKSKQVTVDEIGSSHSAIDVDWNAISLQSVVEVDGKGLPDNGGLMDNVSDVLKDVLNNIIGTPDLELEASTFADLKTARTQPVAAYLDTEIAFNTFVERLESGHLFKFLPTLAGKHGVYYYQEGEPSGTPHLMDEDFLTFTSLRDFKSVKWRVKVRYDMNPTTQVYAVREKEDDFVLSMYRNKETLIVETYLKEATDAEELADIYHGLIKFPQRKVKCAVPGQGFDMMPTQKVKITRRRADNVGGAFTAELFRVLELDKSLTTGTVNILAVLDSQSFLVEPNEPSVSDVVTVGENISVWTDRYHASVSDSVTLSEYIDVDIITP